MAWLLASSLKAALLLAASGLGTLVLWRGTAAARHQVWALGVAGVLVLPLLGLALPALPSTASLPPAAGRALEATMVLVTGGPDAAPRCPAWLSIGWAAGALLLALRFLRAHLAARRLSRGATPANAESWSSALRQAAGALAMSDGVFLGRSGAIGAPMTVGVWRPRVLLPAAADGWSSERLRAVLIHELGHVRRRDTLVQLGAHLACVLYWWNPLVWLAAARLRWEREHACDDLVLGAGVRASSYAADLLEVARSPELAGAVAMMARSGTELRVRRILDPATPRRPTGTALNLALRGTTLALAVALACTASPTVPSGPVWLGSASLVDARLPRMLLVNDLRELTFVTSEVQRHVPELQRCYGRRLLARPGLTGTVIMRWTISKGGVISEHTTALNDFRDEELTECVEKLVRDARFSVPAGAPVEVSIPFSFGRGPPPPQC